MPRHRPRCHQGGTRFLFGKEIEISCVGIEALESFLREAGLDNKVTPVNEVEISPAKWNNLMKFAHEMAYKQLGSFQALRIGHKCPYTRGQIYGTRFGCFLPNAPEMYSWLFCTSPASKKSASLW